MFAVMAFDRDPMRIQDVPAQLFYWTVIAGGWAACGVFLWLLGVYTRMRAEERARIAPWKRGIFLTSVGISLLAYVIAGLAWLTQFLPKIPERPAYITFYYALIVGGVAALVAACLPFLAGLTSLRFRRIWALAKLSFKEAIRNRVLYGFSAMLLVLLFGTWFIPYKPEYQVRSYVGLVYWVMKILLLVTAVILAAFSIPTDIRRQTIHTIVTKPVERFEIVLGRFLGFTLLMTLVLLLMTSVSVVYVLRGVDPAAAEESLKAREPFYGMLHFENTGNEQKGTNVGREWDYRSYITASPPNQEPQYAIWDFPNVPRSLADRDSVRGEFAFDIYRTTKGFENRGVSCKFEFQTANFNDRSKDSYYTELSRLRDKGSQLSDAAIYDELAEKYGYYALDAKDITDYHTQYIDVPAGLFRNIFQASPASAARPNASPLQARVSVTQQSSTQYVGMAKYDFYWRLDDPKGGHEMAAFAANFYKGAFGLWLRLCLVIGLAVALSTYLSGVISMLVAGMLYLGGGAIDYIQSVAFGTAAGGGPMEALFRLANRQVALIQLEEGTAATLATSSDVVFRWFIRRVLDLIPDVNRYDMTTYVGEGFNIPWMQLLLDCGTLALYLLPWFIVAYYLLKWREIAGPT
jgi:ABC-type transport system involved in multi-copper enzyme maturation permease subunit